MGVVLGVAGVAASLASTGYSAYEGHEGRKDAKELQEEQAAKQALLEQQARDAAATAEKDARSTLRLAIDERKRSNTWKTRDLEEDKLGLKATTLGSK